MPALWSNRMSLASAVLLPPEIARSLVGCWCMAFSHSLLDIALPQGLWRAIKQKSGFRCKRVMEARSSAMHARILLRTRALPWSPSKVAPAAAPGREKATRLSARAAYQDLSALAMWMEKALFQADLAAAQAAPDSRKATLRTLWFDCQRTKLPSCELAGLELENSLFRKGGSFGKMVEVGDEVMRCVMSHLCNQTKRCRRTCICRQSGPC